jgi:agmatinase
MPFDPDAAAQPGSGIFGLPFTRDESRVILVPVPFDATTSYGGGTAAGPAAILLASAQVDLYDHQFGRVYERGIHMLDIPDAIADLSRSARNFALPIIEHGGVDPADADDTTKHAIAEVRRACESVAAYTHDEFTRILREGKTPGLIGGDHSTPLGAISAVADFLTKHPHAANVPHAGMGGGGFGILHVDAHMDLRDAFEGFQHSHASIMHNVLTSVSQVTKIVQFGIRDFGEKELAFARAQGPRVSVYFDQDIAEATMSGTPLAAILDRAIAELPPRVYVSFDIDALDPSLCPHTGTPVPGGLSFSAAALLLKRLKQSGRRVIGFDLVEVCPEAATTGEEFDPGNPGNEWDASVGARLLYKLCAL